MASILDLFPQSRTVTDAQGTRTESLPPKLTLIDFLKSFFTKPEAPKQTGPGFDQPMLQPKGDAVRDPVPEVMAVESLPDTNNNNIPDIFEGYNKSRGTPNKDITKLLVKVSQKYKVPIPLLTAMIFNESGFNPHALNKNTDSIDRGIAQINSKAHPEITDDQAFDPEFAIDFMAKKLRGDIDYFKDINKGVQAYNVGRGGAGNSVGQAYLDRVTRNLTPEFADQQGIKYSPNIFGQ